MLKYKLYRKWFVLLLLILIVPMLAVMVINYMVDPMWCFNHKVRFAEWRFEIDYRQQKTNLLRFRDLPVETLIIGSSRVMNIDPLRLGVNCFNFGVSGCLPIEYQTLLNIFYKVKGYYPRNIIIGLDFCYTRGDGSNHRVLSAYQSLDISPVLYRVNTISNFQMLCKSINIVISNINNNGNSYGKVRYNIDYMGANTYYLPYSDDISVKRNRCVEVYSSITDVYKTTVWNKNWTSYLFSFVSKKIGVTPFITPEATPLLRAIATIPGLIDDYERMIREAVSVFGGVWNFMYVNSVTSNHEYWLEPSHSLDLVNEWVIDRIYGKGAPPADFGVYVTNENVEEHINEVRAQFIKLKNQKDSWDELMAY